VGLAGSTEQPATLFWDAYKYFVSRAAGEEAVREWWRSKALWAGAQWELMK
jgi:hypothetical protein